MKITRLTVCMMLICLFAISNLKAQCHLDRHNTGKENGWTSCTTKVSPNPARPAGHWIMFDLSESYPIGSLSFWNHNHPDELENGLKNIVIDLSEDGVNWVEKETFVIPQAPGSSFYEGSLGPNLEGFPARYILITATSNYGGSCYSLSEISITSSEVENPLFTMLEITEEVKCNGDENGAISVHAFGGFEPYSFSIDGSNFQSDSIFTGLPANHYTVYAKDATGDYVVETSITLNEPDPIIATSTSTDTALYISAIGGSGQLSFSLDGDNFQVSNFFKVIENGFDTFYVRDGNGCMEEFNFYVFIDLDDDGFNSDADCDDQDPEINPQAIEIPNNDIDENCDGIAVIFDNDLDGYNSDEDCDDENADINPGATEIPNNDIDEDCDGELLYIDLDGDGYNSDEDCDDSNPEIYPNAPEIPNNGIDENCDGVDAIIDNDGDGFNSNEDCDDFDDAINPDAEEIPNNDVDEDCDGIAQIIDEDGDGFNSDEDCDDTNADINPDAEEILDNDVDEDCDGIAEITSSIASVESDAFRVFPNPFSDHITLELTAGSLHYMQLINAQGKLVAQLPLLEPSNRIELSGLTNGIYYLCVFHESGQHLFTTEIVKAGI